MKLDKIAERWVLKRVLIAYIPLVALCMVDSFTDWLDVPLNLTALDALFTGLLLIWGISALDYIFQGMKATRERMGLEPTWNNTAIDNLEARIEKLERERP